MATKKVYIGEDDARFAYGKYFIRGNYIGKVVTTNKNTKRGIWEVGFRTMHNNGVPDSYNSEGLEDQFTRGSYWVISAASFVKEAKQIDERVFQMARKVSIDAGKKIDILITMALAELEDKEQCQK